VVSDSTYVVNCFRQDWWKGWLARGWRNSQRQPVANRDLWEPLVETYQQRGDLVFRWVKGHAGDRWNELADRLAVEAGAAQRGRRGDGPDELDTGPDEAPIGPGTSAGRRVAVLGHRGDELPADADEVRRRLSEILEAKAEMYPDLVVVSGLRTGAEQLGAEAGLDLGLPLTVVLPYADPDERWPAPARRRYRELLDRADEVIVLERRRPTDRAGTTQALARRDAWLARNVDEAVVVWDGEPGFVERTWTRLADVLGDDVWLLSIGGPSS
jgi:uncharacterized phage-like protein YoqJ